MPGSAAKRTAPREASGRDLSPAVTEVAERTGELITIRPRSAGPFALLQTPAPGKRSLTHASETGHLMLQR